ncbi:MAG: M28 family metallopeptidase [Bacteroidia bacterium]
MIISIAYRKIGLVMLMTISLFSYSQNREMASQNISELCSEKYSGRGYVNNGDSLAAEFIAEKFSEIGLAKYTPRYFQNFNLDVNTIPTAEVIIDDKVLRPGYDFLVNPSSGSSSGLFEVFYVSPKMLHSPKVAKKVKKALRKGFLPVISTYDSKDKVAAENIQKIKECNNGKTLVYLKDHLTWSVARNQVKGADIWLLTSSFDKFSKIIEINIESELIRDYTSQNVLGYVKGTEYPDSVVIFCGHYDHLGMMGRAVFHGANDNASGIAMLLDMADYFVNNPQKYSIAFIAFGGEEAGLVGSYQYVKDPVIPLSKTKFVFNMDLMGSGEKGATIVNGAIYKSKFQELVEINEENDYLPKIKSRGKAANSDHYFFSESGVPSFFMYLMGEYTHYHVPADNAENLELGPYYDKSFLLIRDYIIHLNE